MTAVEDHTDAMTASFAASTFDSEVQDPWNSTPQGLNTVDLSTILSGIPLPDIYTTAFDLAQPSGGRVTVVAVNKIIGVSGLAPATVEKIMNMVFAPTRSRITKSECSVALALVAMAQKNMELTIENLKAHRRDLPVPSLPGLENIDFGSSRENSGVYSTSTIPKRHPINVGSSMSDPWRNSTYKGNGYPPPTAFIASPQLPTSESNASIDPKAILQEIPHWFLNLDTIRISFAPKREGMFLFKHVNYIVESKSRQTTVIRRYSDFWWLLETLGKRFPYRILPNLPPKRLGVGDEAFLERRLRGLTRFMNALMRHPVLRNDPLVVSFLTEPLEFAVWKKGVIISTDDEFVSQLPIPEDLTTHVPPDFETQLEGIKTRLPAMIDYVRSMVHVVDRIQKRTEATAADFMRYSLALHALADCERQCHVPECYSCEQLSQGYNKIGSHMNKTSSILEDQAKALQRGMAEDLKRHRDLLVSLVELLQRRERAREPRTIDNLQKRIGTSETKLQGLQTSATAAAGGDEGAGDLKTLEVSIEKLKASIASDFDEVEKQRQRMVLQQYTLWMEITYFHKNQVLIATLYQNFVQQQMKTSQGVYDNWKSLSPIVHDMPMEVNGFQ
ncbi:hypothetical protein B0O80DRAFT_441321 [Mortierella sp. GBAus27b]|nr:Sorting nexin mvp1 [Mortierella sp. GBA43]KAI8358724.1 hypothetical protein B0O80DRAFT_441321 [Mortierella sp. GBAus27b]